ncbi:Uncharacterized protein AArcCO_0169 [Halalkaliarchaeum sp. AArc-CO]|uniref:hypothetical protein n=1 Tax=unclassified Halalkaliarchaeum TaxID=2678344 RepID=UPI00217DE1FB|nr:MULTISPECIES: hypothetical protein [unclassified Halalkaliarchaeum]MDR5673020.1 hypothetical protein [Halalkaliarchaeum sp. AArc-GB]UWG49499.1 Uncharacterized protein AArcCO_0169 [Halalkaliarchaeum sp. AArc-CO]
MTELQTALRETFETNGYDVAEVSVNRDRVRIVVLEGDASADDLEALTHEVLDPEETLGLNVTTETIDGQDVVGTVVSFRRRA